VKRLVCVAGLLLAACSSPQRDAADFAADPEAALRTVAECDAGARRPECAAAREGLAKARRRERMDAYARTFGEP
jgi:hypothetical protein